MSFHIDHYPNALADIQKNYRWYRRQSARAAKGFLEAMDQALGRISENPRQFAEYFDDTRVCVLKRYPYLVIFRMYRRSVTIYAVSHAKRSQLHWRKRLP